MTTRTEHMAWCKQRALAYVDRGDLVGALASFGSDITKHPDTNTQAVVMLVGTIGMMKVAGTPREMREFIEGFA